MLSELSFKYEEVLVFIHPPLQDLPEDLKNSILNERERILKTAKKYKDGNLDPRRKNILNPFKENFEKFQAYRIFSWN